MGNGYRDKVSLKITTEDWGINSELNTIIDAIHRCGCGGHSFNILARSKRDMESDMVGECGGYDGDGADEIHIQIAYKLDNQYIVEVGGTRCGMEAIFNIVDKIVSVRKQSSNAIYIGGSRSDGVFGSFGWDLDNTGRFDVNCEFVERPILLQSIDMQSLLFLRKTSR